MCVNTANLFHHYSNLLLSLPLNAPCERHAEEDTDLLESCGKFRPAKLAGENHRSVKWALGDRQSPFRQVLQLLSGEILGLMTNNTYTLENAYPENQ